MDISISFLRTLFIAISLLVSIIYTSSIHSDGLTLLTLGIGVILGSAISALLIGIDTLLRHYNMRTLTTSLIGLFFGILLAKGILIVTDDLLDLAPMVFPNTVRSLISSAVYLLMIYISLMMVARAAEEVYVSIPFIKFSPSSLQKKDLLLDSSILQDARFIDLAASGLIDHHLIIARFLMTEIYSQLEIGDEATKAKAKRCLEVVKKLETIPNLGLRYNNTDFPEIKENQDKLIKLARFLDANILTSEMSQIKHSLIEDVKIIKFQDICNALKPLSQSGEYINIKIQRYGKEPRQGVGYLDDGTMVVVNGGAEYIGETIKSQVLSVKHTSSGRMIFCNAVEDPLFIENNLVRSGDVAEHPRNYFAL
jgi:uncharacterized protein YacL